MQLDITNISSSHNPLLCAEFQDDIQYGCNENRPFRVYFARQVLFPYLEILSRFGGKMATLRYFQKIGYVQKLLISCFKLHKKTKKTEF